MYYLNYSLSECRCQN